MSETAVQYQTIRPQYCTAPVRSEFAALIRKGGEVAVHGLEARIEDAAWLVLLRCDGQFVGTAAIKSPLPSYRRSVSHKAEMELSAARWPYELGWVFVEKPWRKRGYGDEVVKCALAAVGEVGVFSTSRTTNEGMHRRLVRFGFAPQGKDYSSEDGDHQLRLFLRL